MKMRRIYISLCLITGVFLVDASDRYKPILEPRKVWRLDMMELVGNPDKKHTPYMEVTLGEEIIEDGYKSFVINKHFLHEDIPDQTSICREKDRILYFKTEFDSQPWLPLLDFNPKTGESTILGFYEGTPDVNGVYWHEGEPFTILAESSYLFNKYESNQLEVVQDKYWIEGIGSPEDIYLTHWPKSSTLIVISECLRDGNKIFDYDEWRPSAGLKNTVYDERSSQNIYDLMGNLVDNPYPNTIYVRQGRKYIFR